MGLAIAVRLSAVVLTTVRVKCPICGEQNEFYGFVSFGGYVYYYASKFQMVFFPHTYPTALWTCKRCHYTAWAGDFTKIPAEKVAAVRKAVGSAPQIPPFKNYAEVPMAARLAMAELVYHEVGTDDLFWSQFYREKGYHLGLCGRSEDAMQSRLKARDLLIRMVADPKYASQKEELLVSLAAMEHFTGDDRAALETLAQAAKETSKVGNDGNGKDKFLTALIGEYSDRLKSKSVPSDEQSLNPLPGIANNETIEPAGQERIWTVRACGN